MATFVWAAAANSTWATGASWKIAGVAQSSPPTAADDAVFGTGTGATNSNCTTAAGDVCRSLTINNAYTGTLTIANSATGLSIGDGSGGAVSFGTGATYSAAGSSSRVLLVSTSTNGGAGWALTFNGVTLPFQFGSSATGSGRWTFQDNFSSSEATSNALRCLGGTINVNNKNCTFTGAAGGVTVNGGTLIMGTGTFTYQATSAATIFVYTSGTITGGSETHSFTGTTTNARTFGGGGQSYGALQHRGSSTGIVGVTGSNTFASILVLSGQTLRLTAGTTTTITAANGLGAMAGTLNSLTAASAATVALTSSVVSVMRTATLKDITVTPNGHAYALSASVSTSGNTGINFNTPFGWGLAS